VRWESELELDLDLDLEVDLVLELELELERAPPTRAVDYFWRRQFLARFGLVASPSAQLTGCIRTIATVVVVVLIGAVGYC